MATHGAAMVVDAETSRPLDAPPGFRLRRADEVLRFLREHPLLVPLLAEARRSLDEHFGPGVEVVLEVVADPEVPQSRELFGYIHTELSPDEAGARLRRFDRAWLLDSVAVTRGILNFDLEFR